MFLLREACLCFLSIRFFWVCNRLFFFSILLSDGVRSDIFKIFYCLMAFLDCYLLFYCFFLLLCFKLFEMMRDDAALCLC